MAEMFPAHFPAHWPLAKKRARLAHREKMIARRERYHRENPADDAWESYLAWRQRHGAQKPPYGRTKRYHRLIAEAG